MSSQNIDSIKAIFQSRLTTLEHLLKTAETHFSDESFLQQRIIADMFPLGTQITFTCNQPRNFALWCEGQSPHNLDPDVTTLSKAYEQIESTQKLLTTIKVDDTKLDEFGPIELGQNLYLELSGHAYVHEFLIPNFYFHVVTAYDILRMAGVPIGKRDYMRHLMPFIKKHEA